MKLSDLDETLINMAREQARIEKPEDGFVSSMRHHDATGDINGLLIYAWGPTAEVLARNLGLTPVRPFGGPLGVTANLEAPTTPVPARQITAREDVTREVLDIIDAEDE